MDSTNNATAPMATVSAVPATAMDLPTPRKRARSPDGGGQGRGKSRSRGARGGHNKRSDMGRAEWSRNPVDKRARNNATQIEAKRRKLNNEKGEAPIYAVKYSKEEIEEEERKPKRKVAVMIGYSGSGYKGMQLNNHGKTIEGDLFGAFVAAGAISKANANDPKKSSLVRCARTDKGVHAAGNVISLKLIIEDPDIVKKINDNLSAQIRVWGIERTNASFSAYQLCDSRIYEYLIPTHCFLPPHPDSFLGKKLLDLAEEAEDREGYDQRQEEASFFWAETEDQYIKPVLENMDPSIRPLVSKALYNADPELPLEVASRPTEPEQHQEKEEKKEKPTAANSTDAGTCLNESLNGEVESFVAPEEKKSSALDLAVKQLKAAYITAKKDYRIHPKRLDRVRSALSRYVGTHNYHNYTIQKTSHDPSAKRVIKTFVVGEEPVIINNTEWLSLKVHGQSFMMHQIRKMVSMAALVVRCGCHEGRIQDSYTASKISIPKAPGLGLLLERPVFDTYNGRMATEYGKEKIEFTKYEKEMEEFKQREIYERIFREEERDNQFHTFFASIDNFKDPQLLYLSSVGLPATKKTVAPDATGVGEAHVTIDDASSDEDADPEDG